MESFDYSYHLYYPACLCFCYHIVISIDNSSSVSYEKHKVIMPQFNYVLLSFSLMDTSYFQVLKKTIMWNSLHQYSRSLLVDHAKKTSLLTSLLQEVAY